MIIGFILVLLVIWTTIGLLVYSTVLPFVETLGTIKFYNSAYYGAVSSVERAQLVLRYKEPGFEGTGWRIGPNNVGPQSDHNNNDMWQLWQTRNRMFREISSRTSTVPTLWTANTPHIFKETNNDTFNTLTYNRVEKLFLTMDNTTNPEQYYQATTAKIQEIGNSTSDFLTLNIRLNPFIYDTWFNSSDLCFCDQDWDRSNDDKLLSRSIWGKVNNRDYRINPAEKINVSEEPASIVEGDTFLREGNFAWTNPSPSAQLTFDNSRNPLSSSTELASEPYYTIIAPDTSFSGSTFSDIFSRTDTSDNYLLFELVNFVYTEDQDIYPFIEYNIDTNGRDISDKYYRIKGIGKINDYNVVIEIFKPTSEENIATDFTVIF